MSKLPEFDGDNLDVARGVNYTQLQVALAAGDWAKADSATAGLIHQIMMRLAGKYYDPWRNEDWQVFPCVALQTIDQKNGIQAPSSEAGFIHDMILM